MYTLGSFQFIFVTYENGFSYRSTFILLKKFILDIYKLKYWILKLKKIVTYITEELEYDQNMWGSMPTLAIERDLGQAFNRVK